MTSLPIHWIVARAYAQATEEEDRVVHALEVAVSGGVGSRNTLEGQFGNPVVALKRRIDRAEDLRSTWERWREAGILAIVQDDLEERLDDDGVLHFRVDKQSAFGGTLAPARGADPIDIQVKLKAYPAKEEQVLRVARTLLTEAD